MFKSIVWASTIDYPNQVSTVLFVGTCNWNCEYCYNRNLRNNKSIDFYTEILPRLLDRKEFINHVVISGGECTCYDELENIIDTLIQEGFTVGVHSNGSNPIIISNIINKVSFIGMDIKCSDYKEHLSLTDNEIKDIQQSINIILNSNIEYEFRTTLYPKYFKTMSDLLDVANKLKRIEVKEWVVQEYLNNDGNPIVPYSKNYILEIVQECNKIIKTTLKGYIEWD